MTRQLNKAEACRGAMDWSLWDRFSEDVEDDLALIRKWAALLARVGDQLLAGGDEEYGYAPGRPASHACHALPGSPAKLEVLERRAARGEVLFDARDATVAEHIDKTPRISAGNFKCVGFQAREQRAAG